MVKVIHSSLRESRTLDNEDSVSSLWIWNSGNVMDTIQSTSDDDDSKWYNNSLGAMNNSSNNLELSTSNRTSTSGVQRSPSGRSRLSMDSSSSTRRTPSSGHSSTGNKPRLSLNSKMLQELSQAPPPMLMSPSTRKERLSFHNRDIDLDGCGLTDKKVKKKKVKVKSPPRNPSIKSYNSDDYGIEGEMNLEENNNNTVPAAPAGNSLWNRSGYDKDEDEVATERGDSDYMPSPAPSMSKYVKRLGTSSESSSVNSALHFQASDPDMQPRVVEVDEDDDLDSVVNDAAAADDEDEDDIIEDTAHQRVVVPQHNEDDEADEVEDTTHQRLQDINNEDNTTHTKSENVPVSEAAKRQKRIDTELNAMIDEMMQSDDFYEEEEMEPDSYLALMRAAKEICYTRKYYDVSTDKIIYFPSVTKTIVQNDLFEKAEEYYFEEGDEFPADYIMALRGIALDQMVAAENDADPNQEQETELDDDTMMRLSIRVQRTEGDLDELQQLFAAVDAEDQAEEERESLHKKPAAPAAATDPVSVKKKKPQDKVLHQKEEKQVKKPPPPPPTKKEDDQLKSASELRRLSVVSPAGKAKKKVEVKKDNDAAAPAGTMWWETTDDTEQKYKQVDRKSLMVTQNNVQPKEEDSEHTAEQRQAAAQEEAAKKATEKDEEIPQKRVSLWWDLGADSELKYKLNIVKDNRGGEQEEEDDGASDGAMTDDEISVISSSSDEDDESKSSEADQQEEQSQVSLTAKENVNESSSLPQVSAEKKIEESAPVSNEKDHVNDDSSVVSLESKVSEASEEESKAEAVDQEKKKEEEDSNDIMKWLKKGDSRNDGLTREMSRISLLLPSKKKDENPKSQQQATDASDDDYDSLPDIAPVDEEESGGGLHEEQTPKRKNALSSPVTNVNDDHDEPEKKSDPSNTEGVNGYKVDQMVPKKRKSKNKDTLSAQPPKSSATDASPPAQQEGINDQKVQGTETNIPEHPPFGDDTIENTMLDDDIEDETLRDDESSTASFEVENIVVVSSHRRPEAPGGKNNKYSGHDSAVSSLHASTYMADDYDVMTSLANMSLASSMDENTRSTDAAPNQEEHDDVVHGSIAAISKITADNSALTSGGASSDASILVRENPDGRSGTWSIGGSYENASKEEIVAMLKKIQSDVLGAIEQAEGQSRDNDAASSTDGAFSLVLKPEVQRTISGITLSSLQAAGIASKPANVPNAGKPKVKKTSRKKVSKSPEAGWKKVAMAPTERSSPRTKRATKSKKVKDNTPLTNLSDVVEESGADGENPSGRSTRTAGASGRSTRTLTTSNREGRKPVGERRTEKRVPRKGRRKEQDEADDFYEFQFSRKQPEPSDGSAASKSAASSKSSMKSHGSFKRASSDKGMKAPRSKSPSKTRARRSKSVSSTDSPKLNLSPRPRRSASVEVHHVPRRKGSKRGRTGTSKALKETLAYEASRSHSPRKASKPGRSRSSSPQKPSRSAHRRSVMAADQQGASASAQKRASSMEPFKNLGKKASLKFGRSSSVPAMNPAFSPIAKLKKKAVSNRHSTGRTETSARTGERSTSAQESSSNHRRDKMREKKESSLRALNRKLDEVVGIQSSPQPSPAPSLTKKKKGVDLAGKVKEVDSIREKFRTSFIKVIKSG